MCVHIPDLCSLQSYWGPACALEEEAYWSHHRRWRECSLGNYIVSFWKENEGEPRGQMRPQIRVQEILLGPVFPILQSSYVQSLPCWCLYGRVKYFSIIQIGVEDHSLCQPLTCTGTLRTGFHLVHICIWVWQCRSIPRRDKRRQVARSSQNSYRNRHPAPHRWGNVLVQGQAVRDISWDPYPHDDPASPEHSRTTRCTHNRPMCGQPVHLRDPFPVSSRRNHRVRSQCVISRQQASFSCTANLMDQSDGFCYLPPSPCG